MRRRRFPVRIIKLLVIVIVIWTIMWFSFLFISSPHLSETKESVIDRKRCPVYSSENNIFSNFTTSYGQFFPTQEHLELIEKHRFEQLHQSVKVVDPDEVDNFVMLNDIRVVIFVHIYKHDRFMALKETWVGTFLNYYPNVKIVTFSSTIRQVEKFISSNNAVHKLVTIMGYGLEKYPNYDFYLKFDDDAYVYPHRLMYFLSYGLQNYVRSTEPFFGGFKGLYSNKYEFLCGGSGYVFNSAAFEKIRDCGDRPLLAGFAGAGSLEDVYFSHWMSYRCGVPMTFFTAFMLGWPEIVMKNFDVEKFTTNNFPLDLPITYHYITPLEMTSFLETERLIPKIIYVFEEDPLYSIGKTHWLGSNCYHMIFETNQYIQKKRILEEKEQEQENTNNNQAPEPLEKIIDDEATEEERMILEYLEETEYVYEISNSSHALETSAARFPELVEENVDELLEEVRMSNETFYYVNPVLKFMMLYNTGGMYIHPSLDCRNMPKRNVLDELLITAYEMGKEVVVFVDQRVDEILFLASVKRSDALLLILRDALFETKFKRFDMGEWSFQRLFHYYGGFMEEKVLMLSNVNQLFQCNNQEYGVLEEVVQTIIV